MNANKLILSNLPKNGSTITYGKLREKTKIKDGLGDILYKLKKAGKLYYESDPSGTFPDSMEISLPATAKSLSAYLGAVGFASA